MTAIATTPGVPGWTRPIHVVDHRSRRPGLGADQAAPRRRPREGMRYREAGREMAASGRLRPNQTDRGALTAKAPGDVVIPRFLMLSTLVAAS